MGVKTEFQDDTLYCYLSGEIDHHQSFAIRLEIDDKIENSRPKETILDFTDVTFMDSSGIGLVMGRYKLLSAANCTLSVRNLSPHAYKVMRLAGLDALVTLQKRGEKGGKQYAKAEK